MQGSGSQTSPVTDLLRYFTDVRSYTEALCEPLESEDYIPQPVIDVSPAKWNIAHTTWFFEEMILKKYVAGYHVFNEHYAHLFNSYYDSVGERTRRDRRGDLSRPTVKQVFAYRKYVDDAMAKLLTGKISDKVRELVILGLNHEQQHQELFLTDLKYTFAVNPLYPTYRIDFAPEELVDTGSNEFLDIKGGIYEIGYSGDGFCFDNERSRHKVYLDDYAISSRLVTNAEFIEFIDAGGYSDFRLWHSEGWEWVNHNKIETPLYWKHRAGGWTHYTLGGLRPLPPEAPVCHITYYEAAAYAEFRGMRLPTEAEWEAASSRFYWGKRWEWTGSAYLPYPGFKKPSGAVGEYNGKFMINQMVLRGSVGRDTAGPQPPNVQELFSPTASVAIYRDKIGTIVEIRSTAFLMLIGQLLSIYAKLTHTRTHSIC